MKYYYFNQELIKIAEQEVKKDYWGVTKDLAKIVGATSLGFGVGSGLGLLAKRGLQKTRIAKAFERMPPALRSQYALGALTGATVLGYYANKKYEEEKQRRYDEAMRRNGFKPLLMT